MGLENTKYTIFAIVDGAQPAAIQEAPILRELGDPSGNRWEWISAIPKSGNFDSNTTFSVTSPNDSNNPKGQHASLTVNNPNWSSGNSNSAVKDGIITVTLRGDSNPNTPTTSYDVQISLREIKHRQFTLFQGQTFGGALIPDWDSGSYVFEAPSTTSTHVNDGAAWRNGVPDDLDIGFKTRGNMSVKAAGGCTWTGEGTFTLAIQDGAGSPWSYFRGLTLRMKKLQHHAYTVFQKQSFGDSLLPSGTSETYTFDLPYSGSSHDQLGCPTNWRRNGIPDNLRLGFKGKGNISVTEEGSAQWSEDGQVTLAVTDGTNPTCYIENLEMRLRKLAHTAYTVFQKQSFGGSLLPGTSESYQFDLPYNGSSHDQIGSPTKWRNGIPDDLKLEFKGFGNISVKNEGGANWSENGDVTLSIKDGGRPTSYICGLNLRLRKLAHTTYTVFKKQSFGGKLLPGTNETFVFDLPYNGSSHDQLGCPSKWRDGIPDDLELQFKGLGNMSVKNEGTAQWIEEGKVTVAVTDGKRPTSYVGNCSMKLRRLDYDKLTLFKHQTHGGPLLPTTGPSSSETYVFDAPYAGSSHDQVGSPQWRSSISDTLRMNFTTKGEMSVQQDPGVSWNGGGTFTLAISDGARPTSYVEGMELKLRKLLPDIIQFSYDAGQVTVDANGPSGDNNWYWLGFEENLDATKVSCSPGPSSQGLPVSTSDQEPGEWGAASIKLHQLDVSQNQICPYSDVVVPVTTDIGIQVGGTDYSHKLPNGRGRMRYMASLEAVTQFDPDTEILEWALDMSSAAGLASAQLELGQQETSEVTNVLQTKYDVDSGVVRHLPNVNNTYTIKISVTKKLKNSTNVVAVSAKEKFTLKVEGSQHDVDVAILLDRSTSMGQDNRWDAACSGAGQFAILMSGATGPGNRRLGVYWFNSNSSGPPAGAFVDSNGQSYDISSGWALTNAQNVGGDCAALTPEKHTNLSQGLLYCRNELSGTGSNNREKILLVLSDGDENQLPPAQLVFTYIFAPFYWGNPGIRIYPLALMTTQNCIKRLQNIVSWTGGLPALDVGEIGAWTEDTPHKISNWFVGMFSSLFGFTQTLTPPDPKLSRNQTWIEFVKVNAGQTKLVFYMTHHQPKPSDWEFSLELPSRGGIITKQVAQTTEGIEYYETKLMKMYLLDFPLRMKNYEHAWTGEWQVVVKRVGRRSGYFGVGAIAKQDVGLNVEIISEAKPKPGNKITINAKVTDPKGRPITNAKVESEITEPGAWLGDYLSDKGKRNPDLFRVPPQKKGAKEQDSVVTMDELIQRVLGKKKPKKGNSTSIKLKHVKRGVYTKTFKVTSPGMYNIDVECTGSRPSPAGEMAVRKRVVLDAALENIKDDNLTQKEIRAYKKRAVDHLKVSSPKKQSFVSRARQPLAVSFLPDPKETTCFGFLEDDTTICLFVEPKDSKGRKLGPGWSEQIIFTTPAGIKKRWQAVDMLDGTYEVEIPMKISRMQYSFDRAAILGNRLTLKNPNLRKLVRPKHARLPLDAFFVEVLGVKMSVAVFALAGNKKTKTAHLVTCSLADKIADDQLEWFASLKEIKNYGFDTCDVCLPLVCNTASMEAHKPTCNYVKYIKKANRIEMGSWRKAKRKGFDGCHHCLPDKHTR